MIHIHLFSIGTALQINKKAYLRFFSIFFFMFVAQTCYGELTYKIVDDMRYLIDTEKKEAYLEPFDYSGDIIVPEIIYVPIKKEVLKCNVVKLDDMCFSECKELTSIKVPSSIREIGKQCFIYCKSLKEINIPEGVTKIGKAAFFDCVRLAKITLPKSLIKIERECFSQCYSLNEVICYAINPPAAEYAFDTFENLYVPDESYDKYCNDKDWGTHCTNIIPLYGLKFEYNEDTKEATLINNNYSGEITIPSETIKNGVTYIVTRLGENCFYESNVTNVTMPNTITTIGNSCFYGCEELSSINLSNSLKSLGEESFKLCKTLKEISIPSSVTHIGECCFKGCHQLTKVQLNTNISELSEGCFADCQSLKSINIPNSVTSLGPGCFGVCTALKNVYIPSSVTNIADLCFTGCYELREISLPINLSYIGRRCFEDTPNLEKVYCYAENVPVSDGQIITNGGCTLYVPESTWADYLRSSVWQGFSSIKKIAIIGEHEYVDLNLPSGKLWATTNLGAITDFDFGTYYRWSSNDQATKNWGENWMTPNIEDLEELITTCSWTWETKNGINGYTVRGNNNNTIFIPAAGYNIEQNYPQLTNQNLFYWSKTPSDMSNFIFALSGDNGSVSTNIAYNTDAIFATIRPIVKNLTNGIKNIKILENDSQYSIYNINGTKLIQKQHGINLIKQNDGSYKKIVIK